MTPDREDVKAEVAVLGAGPGGYVAALCCARGGLNTVLVEKENLGGTCLNWGCIPTKSLVQAANLYASAGSASELGVTCSDISFSLARAVARKDQVVEQMRKGISFLLKKAGVRVVAGRGELTAPGKIEVSPVLHIQADNVILATGSEVFVPEIPGTELNGVLTSRELLDLKDLPQKMTVLGGGIIGMEFACLYASLGVQVTVVEFLPDVLSFLDKDVRRELERSCRKMKIRIITGAKGEEILRAEDGSLELKYSRAEQAGSVLSDVVLVAVGRRPSFDGLDCSSLGIDIDPDTRGVRVNKHMQTSLAGHYAIGDLTNICQLAHVASAQAEVAAARILGKAELINYGAIPSAVFTRPEIGAVGLTEKEALAQGLHVTVGKFPFAANGRAVIKQQGQGFVKIIAAAETGQVLGAVIVGPDATELVSELTLAVQKGLSTEDIAATVHAHPTLSETIFEAALACGDGALHAAR